ncbi:MAG TPA: hypothetical protein VGM54_13355 [Chthoniobacter sp.]|jgi:hypothetical protein
MTNNELIARMQSPAVSKAEILSVLRSVSNHVVIFNALLAAAVREWEDLEPIVADVSSLFDRPNANKRVAMGSTLRTLAVFALGKLRHSHAPREYQKLRAKLDPAEVDSLDWLERNAPPDIAELLASK